VQDTGFGVRHTGADEYSCKLLCKSTVSDPVEAASTKPTVFGLSVRTLRWLCHLSHLLLVALHLILVAVHVSRLDHNVVMPIIHSWLPTVVSVSLQAYYTIYSTFLVTLTQRLGLLRALHRRQKLTFIADASTAWSGFGSALIGLRNNFHVLAGFLSTAIITAYLACVMTLHIVSSSIMSLQPFNQTMYPDIPSRMGWPSSFANLSQVTDGPGYKAVADWQMIAALTPGVGRLDEYSSQGLSGATLYDTMQLPNAALGAALVNATTIGFDCGLVPRANLSTDVQSGRLMPVWNGAAMPGQKNMTIPYVDQVLFSQPMSAMAMVYGVDVMYMITTSLSSSDASLNKTFGLPMNWTYQNAQGNTTTKAIQTFFAGCFMSTTSGTAAVDVQTNAVQNGTMITGNSDRGQREWGALANWERTPNTTHQWFLLAQTQSPSSNTTITRVDGSTFMPSLVDYYFMQQLGIDVPDLLEDLLWNQYQDPPNPAFSLSLADFEDMLARTAAGMLWTAGRLTQGGWQPEIGAAAVSQDVLVWRLNINLLPLLFALFASSIMLGLAVCLVGLRGHNDIVVSNVGILETLWLAEREPSLHSKFGGVGEPTVERLRAAGMFDVCLSDEIEGLRGSVRATSGHEAAL